MKSFICLSWQEVHATLFLCTFISPDDRQIKHLLSLHVLNLIFRGSGCDQSLFLFSRQLFDRIFPAHCFLFILKFFIINQGDRPSVSGVFCPGFSAIMSFKTLVQIICPSGIKRAVTALQYISVTHSTFTVTPFLCKAEEFPRIISSNRQSGIFSENDRKTCKIDPIANIACL